MKNRFPFGRRFFSRNIYFCAANCHRNIKRMPKLSLTNHFFIIACKKGFGGRMTNGGKQELPEVGFYFKSLLYSRSLVMASARFSCKVMRLR